MSFDKDQPLPLVKEFYVENQVALLQKGRELKSALWKAKQAEAEFYADVNVFNEVSLFSGRMTKDRLRHEFGDKERDYESIVWFWL